MGQKKEKLHLQNAVFMGVAHGIGIVGICFAMYGFWKWQTIVLGAGMFCISGLGITVGYHRYFTHNSFKCGRVLQLVLAICGTTAVQNSVIRWVSDHKKHHQNTDRTGDPYDASRGFWHAHIGWILFKDPANKKNFNIAPHLIVDPWTAWVVNFQHTHYYALAIFFSGVVPVLIASLWGDPVGGLVFAGFSRLITVWHMTFCINSLAHTKHWGSSQPYSRDSSAQDSWMVSLFTFGEGYHNYHHAFPGDYRNGPYWYNFDPSKWLIFVFAFSGLVADPNRVPKERIEAARRSVLGLSAA